MSKFNELISGDKPVLVDFYATWCGPCKMMAPILEQVKSKFGDEVSIIKIDVDKNMQLAQQHGIKGVPTLKIFSNGKELWKGSGVYQANQLEAILNNVK